MILNKISKMVSSLNKGVVTDYALYILIGICFYLSIFTFFSLFYSLMYCITISCLFSLLLYGHWNSLSKDSVVISTNSNLISGFSFTWLTLPNGRKRCLTFLINNVFTFKFITRIFILLLSFLMGSELFNLDGEEENLEGKGKEKAIDESEENKEKKDEAVKETYESKYKAGYMTMKFEEMFDQMAKWENQKLEDEKKIYEETGHLEAENLHSRIAGFREDDEVILKELREKVEKVRIAESPDDVGSSSNKREYTKDDDESLSEESSNKKERTEDESKEDSSNQKESTKDESKEDSSNQSESTKDKSSSSSSNKGK